MLAFYFCFDKIKFIMNILHLYKRIFLLLFTTAFLFFAVVAFAYCFVLPQYAVSSGGLQYKKSLLESIDTNKIIIVGDSNAEMSISARVLTEETGIRAVNCALPAANGHIFDNNIAFFNTKPGDIVLACYVNYDYDDEKIAWENMWALLENNIDTYPMLKGLDIPHVAYAFPQYIESATLRFIARQSLNDGDYFLGKSHLDEFGDIDHKFDGNRVFTLEEMFYIPKYNNKGIQIMNDYNKALKERGVTLLVASAPIPLHENSGGVTFSQNIGKN